MGAEALDKVAGISDAAVQARTGKGWAEWFRLLDAAGAAELSHAAIARHLSEACGCPDWWSQMVTVGYEQTRGLRQKHQTPGGFQASASKTVAVPVSVLYAAWSDSRRRRGWLPDADFTVRKATPDRSLRITWVDGSTSVEVMFYAKGADKSQVTVQHSKLPDADAVARQKAYWAAALGRLKERLENGR